MFFYTLSYVQLLLSKRHSNSWNIISQTKNLSISILKYAVVNTILHYHIHMNKSICSSVLITIPYKAVNSD